MMSIGKLSLDEHQLSQLSRVVPVANMKYTATTLFCLAVTAFAVAKAASVSGQAGIDRNSVFAGGRLVFPRIPGLNAPISNIFPSSIFPSSNRNGNRSATTTTAAPNNSGSSPNSGSSTNGGSSGNTGSSTNSGSSPLSNIAKLFDIPDPASLIPDDVFNGNRSSDAEVPSLPGLPDLSDLAKIPGLSNAIEDARQRVQQALQLGPNIAEGIQQAMQEAFDSDDPVSAIRTIIRTIIDAYLTVAANCPVMVVGSRVLQEGIRLAIEAARAARNVVFGTTSAPAIF